MENILNETKFLMKKYKISQNLIEKNGVEFISVEE